MRISDWISDVCSSDLIVSLDQISPLKKTEMHDFDVVVDRLRVKPESQQRLAESFETALGLAEGRVIALNMETCVLRWCPCSALGLAEGRVIALNMDTNEEHTFSSRYACPVCHPSLTALEPRLRSDERRLGKVCK